jgi:hypothetical protein
MDIIRPVVGVWGLTLFITAQKVNLIRLLLWQRQHTEVTSHFGAQQPSLM